MPADWNFTQTKLKSSIAKIDDAGKCIIIPNLTFWDLNFEAVKRLTAGETVLLVLILQSVPKRLKIFEYEFVKWWVLSGAENRSVMSGSK
ncbi:hypothetical protein SMSP2_01287 [Limihaloglobus sulfuriphilus]|uniref:Uncharacterized protein n=1 Tax=Limihaloglobus sulfuriphilus TaxID=1851148 RepID=A0A1Q2ME55_9BACT|nr:hypothetical protein SMSP2_01287 [Limihaloglobus sulfuriphilus]